MTADPFESESTALAEVVEPSAALVKMREDFRVEFAEMPWVDSSESGARIALQILSGDPSLAGAPVEARSVRNLKLVNKPHTIIEFALDNSTFDSYGPDFYAQISAVDADGSPLVYSIGGYAPLAQLGAWHRGGLFPKRVMITERQSRQGNPAYRYVDA